MVPYEVKSFGYNDTPLITSIFPFPEGVVLTREHCRNKNEYFSRPAAQGGLHGDSQGSSLKDRDSLGVFRFSDF